MSNPPPLRVLLTGAAGFIGSSLARGLLERGHRVQGLDDLSGGWPERLPDHPRLELEVRDVSEPGVLAEVLARGASDGAPFDHLVHLAARVGVRSVLRDPEGCRAANLRGVREIVAAVAELGPENRPRVWAASSSEVYAPSTQPLREGDATRDTRAGGRWAYAASKLRGEEILDEAAALWPAARGPVHLRFFNVVGPGQDAETGMVLPTFVEAALAGRSLPVHGDGSQVRTFALVDEVARVLRELLERDDLEAGPLNVGGAARTSILELAREVSARAPVPCTLEFTDPRRSHGANFEGIAHREPELGRLRASGALLPSAPLARIVDETLRLHAERARPAGRAARPAACASPAS